MSYSNRTNNLDLPQYVSTDKPTYLGDFNQAMVNIDSGYASNKALAEGAEATAQLASQTASQAQTSASQAGTTASQASETASQANATASQAQQVATNALSTANVASASASTALDKATQNETDITNLTERVNKIETYSTTETQIGKWNNKPLYRNIIIVPKSSMGSATVNINISNLNIAEIYDFSAILKRTDNVYFKLPRGYGATDWQVYYGDVTSTSVKMTLGASAYQNADSIKLIVEYTKTTD